MNSRTTTLSGRSLRLALALALLAPAPLVTAAEARPDSDVSLIEAALPERAPAIPRQPRRLLIFDLNVGYPGHASIAAANTAVERMGRKTGAFATTVSRDPQVFQRDNLRQFDAVFFNNTVGNCFTNADLRRNLVEFVYAGGGLMGVHGTSVGFTRWPGAVEDWPEFGLMIGARGARHRASDERVFIRLDDPTHPLLQVFGGLDFAYQDEFFRFGDPYSRDRLRVLMTIDVEKTGLPTGPGAAALERADRDFALAWVQSYGRGRTFYSTIAHHPQVFRDRRMLEFYLAAAQFVLGDLPAPTIASARLNPAIRAQEKLGWRLGVEAYTFHRFTLFEAIDKTAQLGLPYAGGLSFQKVSREIPKNFAPGLTPDELRQVREKLAAAGVRLLTYYIQEIPGDEAGCRQVFEFGRQIGIETFMTEPKLEALDTIARCCDLYDIKVALHNHDQNASPNYWNPEGILRACAGRTPRLGACADLGYWMRGGIDPITAIRTLKERLITVQMHDLNDRSPTGHDVPWGTGVGQTEAIVREMHRQGLRPTMWGLEYSHNFLESMPEVARCVDFFNQLSLQIVNRPVP